MKTTDEAETNCDSDYVQEQHYHQEDVAPTYQHTRSNKAYNVQLHHLQRPEVHNGHRVVHTSGQSQEIYNKCQL